MSSIGIYFGRDENGVFCYRLEGCQHPGVPVVNGKAIDNSSFVLLIYGEHEVWVYWDENQVRGQTAALLVEHMWRQGDLLPKT